MATTECVAVCCSQCVAVAGGTTLIGSTCSQMQIGWHRVLRVFLWQHTATQYNTLQHTACRVFTAIQPTADRLAQSLESIIFAHCHCRTFHVTVARFTEYSTTTLKRPIIDGLVQRGEDPWDALSYKVVFRKSALYLVAFLQKMTCNLRHPMGLCHPVRRV